MRDIAIVALVIPLALWALRRPWIGVLLWCWLSLMNPHRYTWGFAYSLPLAMVAALCTLVGTLATADKSSPMKGPPVAWFVALTAWITVSWLMGLDPAGDYAQWEKVMKINLMVLVALMLVHTKEQILALAWVCVLSLALLGAKGGVFTLTSGGSYRVWGPPESFIADNNEFALALVMTIPLVRFLQLQLRGVWPRRLMLAIMVLCAVAAIGSHSRGGLLAIVAMSLLLWWRGNSKALGAVVMLSLAVALVAFMPDAWSERMSTIETYKEDRSAMGRISAWWVSWRVAFDYPTGIGFYLARPMLFMKYSPYPDLGTPVAHSIYFQILGHHGFFGLFLFLMVWFSTWRLAGRMRRDAAGIPQAAWCADLGAMAQVSLLGYLVGGAFLSLSYFDFPYYVMAMVVMAYAWMRRKGWETDPAPMLKWRVPGLDAAGPAAPRPASKAWY